MIALGRALVARGDEVWLQTWKRWQEHVEAEGIRFAPAPEYHAPPLGPGELGFYGAAERAARETLPLVRELSPDVVVADILTLAPALAGELAGVPWATLVPHIYPPDAPGLPIYSFGGRLPRTRFGGAVWEHVKGPMRRGLEEGRSDLNVTRSNLGLPPLAYVHGGISRDLALVATFPQLEYPRHWPPGAHVVGPLMWEPPSDETPLPPGDEPLVLVAPSTSQDPDERLVHAALRGLAGLPVRLLVTLNRRAPGAAGPAPSKRRRRRSRQAGPPPVPPNATVVDWLSYARTMPSCDIVVCHAGHGTLARALACGRPVVACPVAGDMAENAARLDWAAAGVRLPRRLLAPRGLRLAVERVLEEPSFCLRAEELARWTNAHDPAGSAAQLVESLADRRPPRRRNEFDDTPTKLRGWDSNPQPLG